MNATRATMLLFAGALVLSGCMNPLEVERGGIQIVLATATGSIDSAGFESYTIVGKGPGNEQFQKVTTETTSLVTDLAAGEWQIDVDAADAGGMLRATGSGLVTVGAGSHATLAIVLTVEPDGSGDPGDPADPGESADPDDPTNLLNNGDFADGTTGWTFATQYEAVASWQVSAGEAVIDFSNPGDAEWKAELFHTGIAVEAGTPYWVQFDGRAEDTRSILVVLQRASEPWTHYAEQTVTLTPTMEPSGWMRLDSSASDPAARLVFKVGGNNAGIVLDNIKLVTQNPHGGADPQPGSDPGQDPGTDPDPSDPPPIGSTILGDGPMGTNLSSVTDWSSEYPFKDIFKMARGWNNWYAWGDSLVLDEDGWVVDLGGEDEAFALYDSSTLPLTRYVCLYDGSGSIEIEGDVTIVAESPGRIVFDLESNAGLFGPKISATDSTDYIRNIRIMELRFESTYESDPWHPEFLENWEMFSVFRFMDWGRTNNSDLARWEDRARPDDHIWSTGAGVPLEVMIDLSNRTGSDAWFTIPHLADDDFIRRYARLVRDTLDPSLKVYIEFSNECWNWQFQQAQWSAREGEARGLNAFQFYAEQAVRMFHLFEDEFGAQANDRLVRVLGAQAGYGGAGQARWVVQHPIDGEPAGSHADALAIAPYFSADSYSSDPQQLLDMSAADITGDVARNISNHIALIDELEANDRGHELVLIAYEGGQHLSPYGDDTRTEPMSAANRDPRMGTLYRLYLDQWRSLGGTLFVSFSSAGRHSRHGMWGILEYQSQPHDQAPKYTAIEEWIADNPVWW